MSEKIHAYSNPDIASQFDAMVSRDTAKQVIYRDIVTKLRELRVLKGAPLAVADIGCGSGHFIQQIHTRMRDTHLYYADYSLPQLRTTAARVEDDRISRGFQFDLGIGIPLLDCSLDCVTSHFVLSEIADLDLALKEYYRILRPRGLFVTTMTSPISDLILSTVRPHKLQGISADAANDSQIGMYTLGNTLTAPHHYRSYYDLINSFHDNGFNLTDKTMMRYYPLPKPDTIIPLPEYLVLYSYKDTRNGYVARLRRRLKYRRDLPKNSQIKKDIVYSDDPREEIYRAYLGDFKG